MATKLKNLKIRKVDFVDEGANPDAHIRMLKRKDGKGQGAKDEVKNESGGILKKLFNFIGKAAGMNQKEIDSAVDEIQKGDSASFSEKINEVKNYKIADEMWDTCYALQSALCSILNDEELDSTSAETAMKESLDEFYETVKESIKEWSSGKTAGIVVKSEDVSETDLELMKAAVERLNKSIKKAAEIPKGDGPDNNQKGEKEEMKIDKSKLTDAEKAFLDSIEKRCGTEMGDGSGNATEASASVEQTPAPADQEVVKSAQAGAGEAPAQQTDAAEDIYKGLHPAVRAELEGLKKFREEAEDRELAAVAKRYAIIGKTEAELVPLLKSLKAAGGTAYNDMIAVLDQAVDTVEKSGAFSEIGKSGHGGNENSAEAKIIGIAKSYMEKDANLGYMAAIAKAWESNPELLAEYDEQAGF